jgi:hypothetical protein
MFMTEATHTCRATPLWSDLVVSPIGPLGPDDVLCFCAAGRPARSTRDLLNVVAAIADRRVGFKSLRMFGSAQPHGSPVFLDGLSCFDGQN